MGSIAYMHSGHNSVVFSLSHVSVIISSHAVPLNRTLHLLLSSPLEMTTLEEICYGANPHHLIIRQIASAIVFIPP